MAEIPIYNQKVWILDLALKALTSGRLSTQSIANLKAALRERFALMSLNLQIIFENIDLWEQHMCLITTYMNLEILG